MDYKIEAYDALCELSVFEINSIPADYGDFGEKYDADPENACDYGCGNMQFFPQPATDEVLNKYNISIDEYNEVADVLCDKLSLGACSWCA